MARFPSNTPHDASSGLRKTTDGKVVFDVTERRHPWFNLQEGHWRFCHESYQGGPEYLFKGIRTAAPAGSRVKAPNTQSNLFKYFKEGTSEYNERAARAHRKNYSKRVVDQIKTFISRKPPARRKEAVGEEVRRFWANADGKGTKISDFMDTTLQWAEVFGLVWLHVDKPAVLAETLEDELEEALPFVRVYFPFDVLDGGFDGEGRLKWIMIRESVREDDDPMGPAPVVDEFTIWDRESWRRLRKNTDESKDRAPFRVVSEGFHGLGFVPFHPLRFAKSENPFVAPGMLDDIAYLDRDVFNKWSQLDTIIYDQTFSQLTMPADAPLLNEASRAEGDDSAVVARSRQATRQRLIEMGTKRVMLYSANASNPPKYIQPDATQAKTVLDTIKSQTEEIYRLAGLLGNIGREVRTQSGVSKAYDFDRLNRVLAFAAKEMQKADRWAAEAARAWLAPDENQEKLPEDAIQYPDNFDVMGLLEELDIAFRAEELDLWSSNVEARLRQKLVDRMFPDLPQGDRDQIFSEIEERRKQREEMRQRAPLSPADAPEMDPGRDDPSRRGVSRDQNPSEVRGAGGGARGPGAAVPTRPTRQQAGAAESAELI